MLISFSNYPIIISIRFGLVNVIIIIDINIVTMVFIIVIYVFLFYLALFNTF